MTTGCGELDAGTPLNIYARTPRVCQSRRAIWIMGGGKGLDVGREGRGEGGTWGDSYGSPVVVREGRERSGHWGSSSPGGP